jgi:orotate phosphoribosyltransferase-like protein
MSGALIAAPVAHLMNKEMVMVRRDKGKDKSHSQRHVEGCITAKRIVILDDLVSSQATLRNIVVGLNLFLDEYEIMAVLLYDPAQRFNEPMLHSRNHKTAEDWRERNITE